MSATKTAPERPIEKSSKRLVYEVVLSEDSGNFKFGLLQLGAQVVVTTKLGDYLALGNS